MPAWSPEIADEFIRLGAVQDRTFHQADLQKLVYIAHGWHLATTGQPLTGDRPEAWAYGPVFRRIAEALKGHGTRAVTPGMTGLATKRTLGFRTIKDASDLEQSERDLIEQIYKEYGRLDALQLSLFTLGANSPWAEVYAAGKGEFRDISHNLIRNQFVHLAQQFS